MIMKRIATPFLALIAVFSGWSTPAMAQTAPDSGRLQGYSDGGLVAIAADGAVVSVRLYGVAALEAGQPFAPDALTFVQEWAMDQTLSLEVITEDQDGIPVAWVRRSPEESLNAAMIAGGYAWWDSENAPEERDFKRLAAKALLERRGLWAATAPLAPWDFRVKQLKPAIQYKKRPTASDAPTPTMEAKREGTTTTRPSGQPKPGPGSTPNQGLPPIFLGGTGPVPSQYAELMSKHQPQIARDKEGNVLGLTAEDIVNIPGAIELGFQNGDIVKSVNGIAIENEIQLVGLVGKLQGAEKLDLVVIRGGKPVKVAVPLR